ncbi:AbgT family transporter [Thiohalorhabdus methylotrophus]|uniref:AbgT family transporter n=1 Tax=Thiohalorhabdus methylotrophus TaxID=3242694 RepID=A0ABV4TZN2_9GAMM
MGATGSRKPGSPTCSPIPRTWNPWPASSWSRRADGGRPGGLGIAAQHSNGQGAWLQWLERTGNRLPDPATLFLMATLLVLLLSQLAESAGWTVEKAVLGEAGTTTETVAARGLLDSQGLWWLVSHLVENFVSFPPLGMVLVAMLGIGLAERVGLLPALIERSMARIPPVLVTPVLLLVGILSSLTLDAGYVVLPPLAAALYATLGRSPLTGVAVAFAGVSAGFSANFVITGLDPLLAGFSTAGARILDPDYRVAVTANWWFMIASTILLPLVGWWVTRHWVEPRLGTRGLEDAERVAGERAHRADPAVEGRALGAAGWALGLTLVIIVLCVAWPGAPLHGIGARFARWVEAIVPVILILFLVPGLTYGIRAGAIRSDRDAAGLMARTMADMGPYIVLAFFAAQFIEAFRYSHLGEMLAIVGGDFLAGLSLPPSLLVAAFVLVTVVGNLFMGSASAKYAFFAPVFVPMFMQTGISPELTQAAYRVGDSVSNIITPLNPYMVVILSLMQRYAREAGLGTLVATMLPYSLAFLLAWLVLLTLWVAVGWPLGPAGPLTFSSAAG